MCVARAKAVTVPWPSWTPTVSYGRFFIETLPSPLLTALLRALRVFKDVYTHRIFVSSRGAFFVE